MNTNELLQTFMGQIVRVFESVEFCLNFNVYKSTKNSLQSKQVKKVLHCLAKKTFWDTSQIKYHFILGKMASFTSIC